MPRATVYSLWLQQRLLANWSNFNFLFSMQSRLEKESAKNIKAQWSLTLYLFFFKIVKCWESQIPWWPSSMSSYLSAADFFYYFTHSLSAHSCGANFFTLQSSLIKTFIPLLFPSRIHFLIIKKNVAEWWQAALVVDIWHILSECFAHSFMILNYARCWNNFWK